MSPHSSISGHVAWTFLERRDHGRSPPSALDGLAPASCHTCRTLRGKHPSCAQRTHLVIFLRVAVLWLSRSLRRQLDTDCLAQCDASASARWHMTRAIREPPKYTGHARTREPSGGSFLAQAPLPVTSRRSTRRHVTTLFHQRPCRLEFLGAQRPRKVATQCTGWPCAPQAVTPAVHSEGRAPVAPVLCPENSFRKERFLV